MTKSSDLSDAKAPNALASLQSESTLLPNDHALSQDERESLSRPHPNTNPLASQEPSQPNKGETPAADAGSKESVSANSANAEASAGAAASAGAEASAANESAVSEACDAKAGEEKWCKSAESADGDESTTRKTGGKRRGVKFLKICAGGVLVAALGLVGGMYLSAPDLGKFYDRSYVLYDKEGNIIYEKMNDTDYHRILTTKDMVDPLYLKMLIASEDERFYSHPGVDPIAIGRAFLSNITSLKRVSGASTLAMQVCRMLEPKDRNIFSKVKEALGALYLTMHYGRDEILTMYLTMAPFGGNIEGVTAASYQYFNHSPKYLSPAEAALLVALPRSPELIRPDRRPKSAIYYRNEVLKRSVENDVIPEDVLSAATKQALPLKKFPIPTPVYHLGQSIFEGKLITPNLKALMLALAPKDLSPAATPTTASIQTATSATATHATAPSAAATTSATYQGSAQSSAHNLAAIKAPEANNNASNAGSSNEGNASFSKAIVAEDSENAATLGESAVLSSNDSDNAPSTAGRDVEQGYSKDALDPRLNPRYLPRELYTTIDPDTQSTLLYAVKEYRHSMYLEHDASVGALAIDNRSFSVVGYVGSFGRDISYVDSIQSVRSPGSALKPFAYGMAFEEGLLHPMSILIDSAKIFESYQPRNYDRTFIGEITAARALQASLNLPALDVMTAVGPDNFVNHLNSIPNAVDLQNHIKEKTTFTHGRLIMPPNADPSLNVVLGGTGITLYNLTQLYAALAHDGESYPLEVIARYPTTFVHAITNDNQDVSAAAQARIKAAQESGSANAHSAGSANSDGNASRDSDRASGSGDDGLTLANRYEHGHYSSVDEKLLTAIETLDKIIPEQKTVLLAPNQRLSGIRKVELAPDPLGKPTKLLNADAARATYNILEGATPPRGYDPALKISYKTGTSYKFRDALAVGSKDNLTVGIWTGRNDSGPTLELSGYTRAAPILFSVLTRAKTKRLVKPFMPPYGLLSRVPPTALTKVNIKEQGRVQFRDSETLAYGYIKAQFNKQGSSTANDDFNRNLLSMNQGQTAANGAANHKYVTSTDDVATSQSRASFFQRTALHISFPTNGAHLNVGSSDTIMVNFSGGVPPYYLLVNDEINDDLHTFKPNKNGVYNITIIDSTGNSVTSEVFVEGLAAAK